MIPRDSASVPSVRPVQRRALIVGSLCLLLLPGWALSQSTEAARSGTAETPAGSDAVDAKPAEKPGEKRDSTPAEQPAEEPGVEKDELAASQPLVREVSDYQEYRGYIEATQSIEIRSSIGGILTEVNIQAGQAVKKGDLLFKIDDRSYRARLDKADAEVARAAAQLKNRELALKGVKDLNARAVVSDGEVTRIEGDRDEAMSSLRAAKALRDLAQLELDSSRISAPITGRISRPQLSVGSQVVAGDTVLATLASTDPMGVAFHVDENTVLKLGREKVGAGLKVGLGPGIPVQIGLVDEDNLPRHGRIESVDSRVDPRSGSLRCLATVPDPEGILIPGLSARVRMMIGKPKKTLLVAPRAVFGSDPQQFVLVVNDQGVVTRRSVRLGKQYDDLRAVDQGLTEGEWIIVNGFDKATLGKNLKPKKAPMPTAAPATR